MSNFNRNQYSFYLISNQDKFLGIVESNVGIVACNVPTTDKSIALKTLKSAADRLHIEINDSKILYNMPSQFSDIIFQMSEQPKISWKEASKVPIDYSLYTSKQQKVVETLRNLNPGEIITYGDLAKQAGFPRAARFVGSTMARNHVPLIVPCHRVVPASKKLGKYSGGGPEIKRKLLKFEGIDI